jgi:hypothetical protein
LPVSDFRWLSEEEIKVINWEKTDIDQEVGYILEVDLKYSKKLHIPHSSFPCAPQKMTVTEDMLSPYALG